LFYFIYLVSNPVAHRIWLSRKTLPPKTYRHGGASEDGFSEKTPVFVLAFYKK